MQITFLSLSYLVIQAKKYDANHGLAKNLHACPNPDFVGKNMLQKEKNMVLNHKEVKNLLSCLPFGTNLTVDTRGMSASPAPEQTVWTNLQPFGRSSFLTQLLCVSC